MRSSDNHYWVALDHIRAMAALAVFIWHFTHGGGGYPVPFEGAPIVPPLAILDEGHTGVSIFMTLSGYLFAKLLDGKKIVYSRFYLNRALRLFPLLLLVMVLKGIEVYLFDPAAFAEYREKLLLGVLLPTWPNGGWSITVEMHFYLLLPLILFFARSNPLMLLALLGGAILLRMGLYWENGSVHYLSYWTIIGRIDQFLLGVFFFIKRDWFSARIPLMIAILAAFYAVYWAFNEAGGFYQLGGAEPSPSPLWIVMPTFEGLAYATAIVFYDQKAKPGSGWLSKIWADYGKFSYSIYLLHVFVVFRAARFINEHLFSIENFYVAVPVGLVLFLGMYPIGWLSYRFVEEPFLRYRKRYTVQRTDLEAATSSQ